VGDEREEAVRRRRDRHAENGGERQEPQVAPAPEELEGTGGRGLCADTYTAAAGLRQPAVRP
jgi:hypothetical protein